MDWVCDLKFHLNLCNLISIRLRINYGFLESYIDDSMISNLECGVTVLCIVLISSLKMRRDCKINI